jgi:hypothetical protein
MIRLLYLVLGFLLGLMFRGEPDVEIRYVAVEKPLVQEKVVTKTVTKQCKEVTPFPEFMIIHSEKEIITLDAVKASPLRHSLRGYVGLAPEIKLYSNKVASVLEPSIGVGYSYSFTGASLGASVFTNKSIYAVVSKEF